MTAFECTALLRFQCRFERWKRKSIDGCSFQLVAPRGEGSSELDISLLPLQVLLSTRNTHPFGKQIEVGYQKLQPMSLSFAALSMQRFHCSTSHPGLSCMRYCSAACDRLPKVDSMFPEQCLSLLVALDLSRKSGSSRAACRAKARFNCVVRR